VTWRNPQPDQFVGARSYGRHVNRTDRLYALVEELRAFAPRRRSARELALRYEVSARTIERDIGALQQAEVTGVTAAPRVFEDIAPCVPDLVARAPVL